MPVDVSSFIRSSKKTSDDVIQLLYRLFMVDDFSKHRYIIDDETIWLIQSIPNRICGDTIKALVDTIILRLMPHVSLPLHKQAEIFRYVLISRPIDIVLLHLNANIDVLHAHCNIGEREDFRPDQIRSILLKWWSIIDVKEYVRRMCGFSTFMLYIANRTRLRFICRCLYELPGFIDKMEVFIDTMFSEALRKPYKLHILCEAGFVPSTEYVVKLFPSQTQKIRIIVDYHPQLIQIFTQINYMLQLLLSSYKSTDYVEILMLHVLQDKALDYVFAGLADVCHQIPGTHLKRYGLYGDPVTKYVFRYCVSDSWNYGSLYSSPMMYWSADWYQLIKTLRIYEYAKTRIISVLEANLRCCSEILSGGVAL